jgi:hypothetical protein
MPHSLMSKSSTIASMIATPQLFSFRQKVGFLRSHGRALAPWPVACGALMTGLWLWAVPSMYQEKNHIRERAYIMAAAQAQTLSLPE